MVFCMIVRRVLQRKLLQNVHVMPTLAGGITASVIIRNPVSIKRLCYQEINLPQRSQTDRAGQWDTRKYLNAIGVDCASLAKHATWYKAILSKDKKTLQNLIHVLQHQGYCKNDIIDLVHKVPQVLTIEPDELPERIELFKSIGFTLQDLLTSQYRSLAYTDYFYVTKSIIQVMRDLLDASDAWIRSLMSYKTVVFKEFKAANVHANIVSLKELLLQHGCSDTDVNKVLLQVIRNDYRLLRIDKSNIAAVVEFFEEKGISGKDFIFVFKKAPNIFQFTSEELEHRMQHLKMVLDMSDTDVKKLVVRYPRAFGMKRDNLDQHIDCFAEMGIDVSYIRNNPFVLWVKVDEIKQRFLKMEDVGIFSKHVTSKEIRNCLYHLNSSKYAFDKDMENYKNS